MDNIADSGNINSLWLKNIFENLKNMENFERYAREGCSNIIEFIQMPANVRSMMLGSLKYQNIRSYLNEALLVLPDLCPVLKDKEIESIRKKLNEIEKHIDQRSLFVIDITDKNGSIVKSETTEAYKITLKYLAEIRAMIINSISHLLYMEKGNKEEKEINLR